jgi:hypothetical protein
MPLKAKLDLSKVKVGAKVGHKVFGVGTIVALKDGRVYVTFGKAKKMFMFPEAFEGGFLKI